eukprot:513501_1
MGAIVTFSKETRSDYLQGKFSEGDTIKSKVALLPDAEVWIEGKIEKRDNYSKLPTVLVYRYELFVRGKGFKEDQKIYAHNYDPNFDIDAEENEPRNNYASAYRLFRSSKGPNVYELGSTSTQVPYQKKTYYNTMKVELWTAKRVSLMPFDCKMRQIPY